MKYTQKRENNTLTVTFKANEQEWAAFDQRAYEQNKGKYSVPGFRKGHVPKNVLENRFGKGLFFEDALYLCAQEYYGQFLDKNKEVVPVARPTLDEKSIKVEKGVTFAIVVTVQPEVALGQYKGLTVEKTAPKEVTDADVEAELNSIRKRNARLIEVSDRPVQDGDRLTIDYCGKVDGEAFEGGTAQDQALTIGSHQFIPGFEEQIVGFNLGETRDINVTFPEDYHAENLKGKQAVFTVTVKAINVEELPEADDDFAKDVSEFNTIEEYKADIRKNITERNAKEAERQDEDKLLQKIVDNTPVDIPNEMIEDQIDQYIEDFRYQLANYGLDMDSYLKHTDSTVEQIRKDYRERAEKAVHSRLVIEAIVKAEGITAGEEAVEQKIRDYAAEINSTYEEFSKQLQPGDRYYFENQVITEELLALLKKENHVE